MAKCVASRQSSTSYKVPPCVSSSNVVLRRIFVLIFVIISHRLLPVKENFLTKGSLSGVSSLTKVDIERVFASYDRVTSRRTTNLMLLRDLN